MKHHPWFVVTYQRKMANGWSVVREVNAPNMEQAIMQLGATMLDRKLPHKDGATVTLMRYHAAEPSVRCMTMAWKHGRWCISGARVEP